MSSGYSTISHKCVLVRFQCWLVWWMGNYQTNYLSKYILDLSVTKHSIAVKTKTRITKCISKRQWIKKAIKRNAVQLDEEICINHKTKIEIIILDSSINYRELICSQGCKGTFWANGDVPCSLSTAYWLHKCIYMSKFIQLYI